MNFVLFYSISFEIIQLLFLPFLKLQGKNVRKKVLKLPEATGNRSGVTGIGKIIKILCIGDSSACGVGVDNMDKSLSGNLINNLKSNSPERLKSKRKPHHIKNLSRTNIHSTI